MTYGITLKNALGEQIAGDGPITYLKDSGTCRIATDFSGYPGHMNWQESQFESFERRCWSYSHVVDGVTYGRYYTGTQPLYERYQWVAASISPSSAFLNKGVPVPLTSNVNDLTYVELNANGIMQAASFIIDSAALTQGKGMVISPSPAQAGTRLKYKVASTDFPAPVFEDYGLLIKDDAGAVVFDSRWPQVPVESMWFVTQAQVEDILDGNLTLTHTLRTPIAELYAHLPLFWCWKYIGSRFYTLHIKKISDTEVQIGRAYAQLPDSSVTGHSTRDMMIFFAK